MPEGNHLTGRATLASQMEITLSAGCNRVRLTFDWLRRKVCIQELGRFKLLFRIGASVPVDGPEPELLPGSFTVEGENMAVVLPDTHQVPFALVVLDAKGNPAEVENVVWASTDESLLIVVTASDGKSAVAAAVGPLGTAQVTVTADADLGEGVVPISGLADVTIVASAAVSIGLVPGPIEPQPGV